MRKLVLTAVATVFLASVACAQTDPMASLFGNTLTVVGEEGTTRLWYSRDNTFTGIDHTGAQISGTWEIQGTQICTHVVAQQTHCGDLGSNRQVGDHWQVPRPNGAHADLTITAGRQ